MSAGGFTAYVNCKRFRVTGGLSGARNVPYVDSYMLFEGKVAVFHYKDLPHRFPNNLQPVVEVVVEFTEKQEFEPYFSTADRPFIGSIRYVEDEQRRNAGANVRVTLPISLVPLLQSMRNDLIQVETIHEIIEEPTKRQRVDSVVALVKRIRFEIALQQNDTKSRRGFSVSFG